MKREIRSWGSRGVLRIGSSVESIWAPDRLEEARFPWSGALEASRPAGMPAPDRSVLFLTSEHVNHSSSGGSYYVCLGASFRPNDSGVIAIRTKVSRTDDAGLSEDLAAYVTQGAIVAAEHALLASGELTFDLAIQHPVDTKPWRYAMAAATIASALRPGLLSTTDEAIEAATRNWLEPGMFLGIGDLRSRRPV